MASHVQTGLGLVLRAVVELTFVNLCWQSAELMPARCRVYGKPCVPCADWTWLGSGSRGLGRPSIASADKVESWLGLVGSADKVKSWLGLIGSADCYSRKLVGPTSFAPAIYQAMRIVAAKGNQYHILLLVADGQVTRPTDMKKGQLSRQEKETIDAIVSARQARDNLPLSIIMVGVGDGPWEVMRDFDDALPARRFDNFQFVNFTEILQQRWTDYTHMEARFALRALMEIPEQYKKLSLMGSPINDNLQRLISKIPPPLDPPAPAKW
ncbi:Copine-domain-containing protein [Dunaliella salina]|uniref:Copine-domain-containing protein n=1 Tax=Dunaliella salina TaxID=3046 RepID=A0ABQ7GSN7_DUNSA|nr:Copine-domain-containing protein [Dunaliella salina]|eukprot:KAF5837568.1 Copine-domain-containing protein [Dunaliella salina]